MRETLLFSIFMPSSFILSSSFYRNSSTCTVEITQYALKGQKLLAQGITLGNHERKPVAL